MVYLFVKPVYFGGIVVGINLLLFIKSERN